VITEEQRDRVERECETRQMVAGTGKEREGTACLMSAVNLALLGRLTDGPNPCVSEVVREMVIGLHDHLPDEIRSGQAWRSLGPLMLGTGGDGHDDERVSAILGWVRGSVLSDDDVPGVPAATYAAAVRAEGAATYADAARSAAHAVAAACTAACTAAYTADRDAALAAFTASRNAASEAAVLADVLAFAAFRDAAAAAAAAADAARKEFWRRADAPGLVGRICEIGR
jgi:hypothetical protein